MTRIRDNWWGPTRSLTPSSVLRIEHSFGFVCRIPGMMGRVPRFLGWTNGTPLNPPDHPALLDRACSIHVHARTSDTIVWAVRRLYAARSFAPWHTERIGLPSQHVEGQDVLRPSAFDRVWGARRGCGSAKVSCFGLEGCTLNVAPAADAGIFCVMHTPPRPLTARSAASSVVLGVEAISKLFFPVISTHAERSSWREQLIPFADVHCADSYDRLRVSRARLNP
jgi:hypothetical protein